MTHAENDRADGPPHAGSRGPGEPAGRTELADHAALLAAVTAGSAEAALAGLGLLGGLRTHLDEVERDLIESAREGGASWAAVATALQLTSRQAAEQRWLRLAAGHLGPARAHRQRQRNIDKQYGIPVTRLRAATRGLGRCLRADPAWTTARPAASLAAATLAAAGEAPPGGLYDLVQAALRDLDGVPEVEWPTPVRAAVSRLRVALGEATPA